MAADQDVVLLLVHNLLSSRLAHWRRQQCMRDQHRVSELCADQARAAGGLTM
jgi:hypothetical protein